jgi:hypothetical protein
MLENDPPCRPYQALMTMILARLGRIVPPQSRRKKKVSVILGRPVDLRRMKMKNKLRVHKAGTAVECCNYCINSLRRRPKGGELVLGFDACIGRIEHFSGILHLLSPSVMGLRSALVFKDTAYIDYIAECSADSEVQHR